MENTVELGSAVEGDSGGSCYSIEIRGFQTTGLKFGFLKQRASRRPVYFGDIWDSTWIKRARERIL